MFKSSTIRYSMALSEPRKRRWVAMVIAGCVLWCSEYVFQLSLEVTVAMVILGVYYGVVSMFFNCHLR